MSNNGETFRFNLRQASLAIGIFIGLATIISYVFAVHSDLQVAKEKILVLEQKNLQIEDALNSIERNVAVIQTQNAAIKEDVTFIKNKVR